MRPHFAWCLFVGLQLGIAGCGRSVKLEPSPTPSTSPASDSVPASREVPSGDSSLATEEVAASGTPIEGPVGRIEGKVTFVGDEIPKSTIVTNTTDPQICGSEISKRDREISQESRGIRYALVWLEDVQLPEGYKPPVQNMVLDNHKCQFEPHAAVITTGSTIETRNSDEIYHTTNLFGKLTKENIPLVSKGASHKTKVRIGELIGVKCDKHGWMQAFIRVDPHPFHAVSDTDGKFSIADVPAGTYKLKVWHEIFFSQDIGVTVKENETSTLDVKYPAPEKS